MTSVTVRATEMCLGANGDQTYCFGDLPLSMWYPLRARCIWEHGWTGGGAFITRYGHTSLIPTECWHASVYSRHITTFAWTTTENTNPQPWWTRSVNVTWTGRLRRRCWGTVTLYSILRATLVYSLSLTGWRLEPKCAKLLHLYDEQKEQVVDTLQTLIDKLEAWGIAERAKWIQKDWWVCETLVRTSPQARQLKASYTSS